jgi:hypothetical protein
MVVMLDCNKRNVDLYSIGIGDVISISEGVVISWKMVPSYWEGWFELHIFVERAKKYHNMYEKKSWYKVSENSKEQPILKRIPRES